MAGDDELLVDFPGAARVDGAGEASTVGVDDSNGVADEARTAESDWLVAGSAGGGSSGKPVTEFLPALATQTLVPSEEIAYGALKP